MAERSERIDAGFDRPELPEVPNAGEASDRRASLDSLQARVAADADEHGEATEGADAMLDRSDAGNEFHEDPDPEFLTWREEHAGGDVERYRPDDVPPPWSEHPANDERERYTYDPAAERAVQEEYAAHGLSQEALDRVNAIGGEDNCPECARSVASMVDGCPRSAELVDGENDRPLREWSGQEWTDYEPPEQALDSADAYLAERGDGAQVVLHGDRGAMHAGHVMNLARVDGKTVLIDAQPSPALILPERAEQTTYCREQAFQSARWIPVGKHTA